MIIQQINLLDQKPSKEYELLGAKMLATVTFVIVFGLGSVYGYQKYKIQGLIDEQAALKNKANLSLSSLQEKSKTLKPGQYSQLLESQVGVMLRKKQMKEQLLKLVSQKVEAHQEGFYRYFSALSRQVPTGVWLRKISIENAHKRLLISGSTVRAQLVPSFLQNLSAGKVFTGTSFSSLKLDRSEEEGEEGIVNFSIKTNYDDDARDGEKT